MGYIRSSEDWYAANGDHRSHQQRAADIREQIRRDSRMPDSIRDELKQEAEQNDRDAKNVR